MPSWFQNPFRSSDHPVATYQALRATSKLWAGKLLKHPANQRFDLFKAGQSLGIPTQNRTFLFEDECDMAALNDYYFFDFRPAGKSLAESASFEPGALTPAEAEFHQACLASRTSLFLITALHQQHPQLLLRDQLQSDQPELWLTDIALTDSFRRIGGQALIFTRVVSIQGLHLTGGFSCVFDPKHGKSLLDDYGRKVRSLAPQHHATRRTGFFFKMNHRLGLQQGYEDVKPPA